MTVVHIDELVLHGFSAGDRHRIADAMQRELARLLGERGLDRPRRAIRDSVDAPPVVIPRGARPDEIGRRVATAVYRALDARSGGDEPCP